MIYLAFCVLVFILAILVLMYIDSESRIKELENFKKETLFTISSLKDKTDSNQKNIETLSEIYFKKKG